MKIVLSILALLLCYLYYKQNKELKKERKKSSDNLGRPEDLLNAVNKLDPVNWSNAFVVQSFIPYDPEPKELSEMSVGLGLLAHPGFPKYPIFFKIVFKFGEECSDGKTLHTVNTSLNGVTYIEKLVK